MTEFRLPSDTQRLAVIGRTGSGKTQAAVWHLSMRAFDRMPWVVFNFKDDELIGSLPGTEELSLNAKVPSHPGVYVINVAPDEKEEADEFLMRAWNKEKCGLFVDEGYMLTGLKGYRRCLTQGRSRRLPMIVLSQRPVWMDRFTWSEADFFQVFFVTLKDDRETVRAYTGSYPPQGLPDHWSVYTDVSRNQTFVLQPVPDRDTLLQTFRDRLCTKRRLLA